MLSNPCCVGKEAEYCDECICLSHLPAYLRNHMSKLHEILSACCLWPWRCLPLAVLQYVMYFRFCGWRHNRSCGWGRRLRVGCLLKSTAVNMQLFQISNYLYLPLAFPPYLLSSRDHDFTYRLRAASVYPRPVTRTKHYTSFINYCLLKYQ